MSIPRIAINVTAAALILPASAGEHPAPEADRAAILSMAGAYTVNFDFRETVPALPGYELHPPYHATAEAELVQVLESGPDRIVLQHLLVQEDRVVKHWRQDWLYENRDLYEFAGNATWRHRRLTEEQARGTWTQRVFEVDDTPRYQGYGPFKHEDGLSSWESNWTWRPLPRREYTKRDDYDVLVGRNRHTLTHTGWVHEQDNYKLVLRDGKQFVLTRESGLNRYDHIDPAKVEAARAYWERTQRFWAEVRAAWDTILVPAATVSLRVDPSGEPGWKALFDLAEAQTADPTEGIRKVLDRRLGTSAAP